MLQSSDGISVAVIGRLHGSAVSFCRRLLDGCDRGIIWSSDPWGGANSLSVFIMAAASLAKTKGENQYHVN